MDIKIIDEKIEKCLSRLSGKADVGESSQNVDFIKGYWQGQLAAYMYVFDMLHDEMQADHIAYSADVIKLYFKDREAKKELTIADMTAMTTSVMMVEHYDPSGAVSKALLGGLTIQQAREKLVEDLSNVVKNQDTSLSRVAQRCLVVLDKKGFPRCEMRAR